MNFNFAKFGNEILGCCSSGFEVKCQRLRDKTDYLIGNSFTIFSSNEGISYKLSVLAMTEKWVTITWEVPQANNLYSYFIFIPTCNDSTYSLRFFKKIYVDLKNYVERKTENILYIIFTSLQEDYGNLRYSTNMIDLDINDNLSSLEKVTVINNMNLQIQIHFFILNLQTILNLKM